MPNLSDDELYRSLATQLGEAEADALMSRIGWHAYEQLARRSDVQELRQELLEKFEGMATKADLEGLATKADFSGVRSLMATRADIEVMATKADLEGMATRADIDVMATKADLEGMATKADVADVRSVMATRADIEVMAGILRGEASDLKGELRSEIADVRNDVSVLRGEMHLEFSAVRSDATQLRGEVAELRAEIRTLPAALLNRQLVMNVGLAASVAAIVFSAVGIR